MALTISRRISCNGQAKPEDFRRSFKTTYHDFRLYNKWKLVGRQKKVEGYVLELATCILEKIEDDIFRPIVSHEKV